MRIVSCSFVKSRTVLIGSKRCLSTNRFCTVINGPVIENICVRNCSCSRASSFTSINLYGLRGRRNSTHIRAVACDRIVNSYLILFPNRKQVFIRLLFVCSDLSRFSASDCGIARAGPYQEVCSSTALGLGPALEGVTRAGLCAKDIYSLIDLDVSIGMIKFTLAIILRTIVAVPIDVGRGFLFLILIDSFELNSIIVFTGLNDSCRSHDIATLGICDLCIFLQSGESLSGKDCRICINIGASVPGLQNPMVKDLVCRRCWGRTGADIGIVLIQSGVAWGIRSAIDIVGNTDTISANNYSAPLGIEIVLLRDPEAVNVTIRSRPIAPLIHGLRHVGRFIIWRSDCRFIQHCAGSEWFCATFICVPAKEFISRTKSGGCRNLATITHTEVHILGLRTPIQCGICSRIRMEEYTVLDLTPFCVYCDAFRRHGRKRILLCAVLVCIPSFKNVSIYCSGRSKVVGLTLAIG